MKKHIAKLLRRAANRIDPPLPVSAWFSGVSGKTSTTGNGKIYR